MTKTESFFVKVPQRGLIHIEGKDRVEFLQRIISNDINLLKTQPAVYACLLTPQGKFLHDFFVSEGPESLIIECEGKDRAQDLFERLNKYKLRSDICISIEDQAPIFISFGEKPFPGYQDPRHVGLGWRCFTKPDSTTEEPFELWDRLRINLEIADGSRDAVLERSTLEELNITHNHGVSFKKGCYVGQELTARVENRGLAKKHLKMVTLSNIAGEIDIRSKCSDIGLAVIKD